MTEILDFLSSEDGLCMDFSETEVIDYSRDFDKLFKVLGNKDEEEILIDEQYLNQIKTKYNEVDLETIINHFYEDV